MRVSCGSRSRGRPASPRWPRTGGRLAIVLRAGKAPSRLVVWSTGPDTEAEKKWRERIDRELKRDPQDVAPVRTKPLARKPLRELVTRDGREPFAPRWLAGGGALLFGRFEADGEGFLHPDLFSWEPETGAVRRLTRLADVRDADPAPDASWAVAVRSRSGLSQLVRVDLATGLVAEITRPSVEAVVAEPRVSPDGSRVAYLLHTGAGWKLLVRSVATGAQVELPTPAGSTVAYPAWRPDGKVVYASLGQGGFIDVVALPADGSGGVRPITRTTGAALAPAPTPDGTGLFYLALHADGLDLRRIDLGTPAPEAPAVTTDLAPAVRPAPPAPPPPLATARVGPGQPYGIGRQEVGTILGGELAPSARTIEAGARIGDVIGRLDVTALGAVGDVAGPRGGALAAAWRGWPITVSLLLFATRERPSRQPTEIPGLGASLDADRSGAEAAASWQHHWNTGSVRLTGGALFASVEPAAGPSVDQTVGFVAATVAKTPSVGGWSFPHVLDVRADIGRTGGDSWRRLGGRLEVGAVREGTGVVLAYQRHAVRDATRDFDRLQLGGVDSSLLPASVLAGRILVPALPAGTRVGDEHEGERATLLVGGLPLFFERHRVWDTGAPRGAWLRLAGIEWDITSASVPLVKAPGLHLTLGVARVLDEPLRDRTEGWLGLAWRP